MFLRCLAAQPYCLQAWAPTERVPRIIVAFEKQVISSILHTRKQKPHTVTVLSLPSVSSLVNFPLAESTRDHFRYESTAMREGLLTIDAAISIY